MRGGRPPGMVEMASPLLISPLGSGLRGTMVRAWPISRNVILRPGWLALRPRRALISQGPDAPSADVTDSSDQGGEAAMDGR